MKRFIRKTVPEDGGLLLPRLRSVEETLMVRHLVTRGSQREYSVLKNTTLLGESQLSPLYRMKPPSRTKLQVVRMSSATEATEPSTEDAELEQDIFNRMKQHIEQGNPIRVDHLAEYIDCKSKALLPQVRALVLQATIDASTASHVMSFFMRSGHPLDAIKVFNTMVSQGTRPNLYTFNVLISSLGRIGKLNIALEVLYQMKKERIVPDKVAMATINSVIIRTTLTNVVSPEAAQENLISARAALEEMRVAWEEEAMKTANKTGLQTQRQFIATLYNALLSVHALLGDLEAAINFLNLLKQQKLFIETSSLNLLMRCCVKKDLRERAIAIYEEEMKKGEGIPPTASTYNLLLRQYSDLGRLDDAWAVLGKMRKRNILVKRHAYNALIGALSKGKQPEKALAVFALMRSQEDKTGSPNIWTYNTALKCCYMRDRDEVQLKKAFSIYEDLKANYHRMLLNNSNTTDANPDSTTPTTPTTNNRNTPFIVIPNMITFTTLLNLCAKATQPQLAFSVFQEMKDVFGITPSQIAYNILINACARAKDVEKAFAVQEDMKKAGLKPDAITLGTLLSACVRAGDVKRAFQIYEEIEQSGLSLETYQTRMFAYARLGNLDKAFELKEEMMSKGLAPHLFGYNNLIHACAKAGDLKRAASLFTEMKSRGVAPDAVTYNILMHEYADQGSLGTALALYKQMKAEGVKPNSVTIVTLVHACSRAGDVEKALALFKEMREEGAPVSPYTFNTLMDACARKGMMESAFALFDEMKGGGYVPDISVYNTLLSGCARKTWEERAFSLMEDMKEQGVAPDRTSYTHMINACARNGSTERAFAIFRDMKENNVSPGYSNYATLIEACAHMGMVDAAFNLYQEMKQDGGLIPDASIYSGLVDVCVRGGELDRAFLVVEEMKKAGHKPDVVLYNALLGGCVRKGWEEKAFSILEEMSKRSIEPDIVTFMTLIHRHAGEGLVEKAEAILGDMLGQGVQPDKAFYFSLIKASRKVGKYTKQVKRWQDEIKKMEEKGAGQAVAHAAT